MDTSPSAALSFSAALRDTIAAIATAPGRGAVALVRLSGPDAFPIAAAVVPGFDPDRAREARLLPLTDGNGELIDRALVTAFPAPHSFSGDDTVEFSTHGGTLVPTRVLAACLAAGARQAMPGEFSRRAVLNGQLDLLQAEAVGDLIDATAPAQARQALTQLDGVLSRRVAGLRDGVLHAAALLAYAIDFPEEDDGPIDPTRIISAIEELQQRLQLIVATARDGERVRRGALVVLAGPPNVGKSSLFNALLGRDRSIVTATPGTTRDAIEAEATVDGWPITLVDTAGLREGAESIEAMGIAISRDYLERADMVLMCSDHAGKTKVSEGSVTHDSRFLLVRTKADLGGEAGAQWQGVSALTGSGVSELRHAMVARLFDGTQAGDRNDVLLTRERHRIAAQSALAALGDAAAELERGEPVLAAQAIARASDSLGDIIGGVTTEEVLARVFEGFCVGK